ncbi:hypothetical protein GH714_040411 [Hevea brasiliensis]|uniref:Uncharacterized protein n=1 Tax=Hevea brasiliensis TaxID=3981 RepID=A0A6A6N580_HEVBR|nr:hypothetical protein GH714_040411 [Hevea brasiliensis]
MAKAAALLGLLVPAMAPTGTTLGAGGRVPAADGVMVPVQAGQQMDLAGVLGLGLGLEVGQDRDRDMVMGLEVVVHAAVGRAGIGSGNSGGGGAGGGSGGQVAVTRRLIPGGKTTLVDTESMKFDSIDTVCMPYAKNYFAIIVKKPTDRGS